MTTFQDGNPDRREGFVERRNRDSASNASGLERRQFGNSYAELSPDARELAEAIDVYKIQNHRRYITFEEMLSCIHELGYSKQPVASEA